MVDLSFNDSKREPKEYQWNSRLKVSDMSKEQLQQAVCLMLDVMEDVNSRQHDAVAQLTEFLMKD